MGNLMRISEVSKQLGVHRDTVRRAIKSGRLKAHRVGTQIRVLPESVIAYIEQNTVRVVPKKQKDNTQN